MMCLPLLLSVAALLTVNAAAASSSSSSPCNIPPHKTDFISCDDSCSGGDVNYELTASVRTMKLLNYTYRGRTYSPEGSDSIMGPTMRVKPGQSLWIKLRNEMHDAPGKNEVQVEDYWRMLQNPGEKIKYQYYKKPASDPSLMKVDSPNIPKGFSNTNLHLHGLGKHPFWVWFSSFFIISSGYYSVKHCLSDSCHFSVPL